MRYKTAFPISFPDSRLPESFFVGHGGDMAERDGVECEVTWHDAE